MEPPHHPSTESEHASRSKQAGSKPRYRTSTLVELRPVRSPQFPAFLSQRLLDGATTAFVEAYCTDAGRQGRLWCIEIWTDRAAGWGRGTNVDSVAKRPCTFVGTGSYRLFQRDVAATLMIALTVPTRVPVPTRRAWHTTAAEAGSPSPCWHVSRVCSWGWGVGPRSRAFSFY